jgi:hypothetical protein
MRSSRRGNSKHKVQSREQAWHIFGAVRKPVWKEQDDQGGDGMR